LVTVLSFLVRKEGGGADEVISYRKRGNYYSSFAKMASNLFSDVYSHQSVHVPGLFAMGPLTGDNFVRYAVNCHH
jgi:hypothetical protein